MMLCIQELLFHCQILQMSLLHRQFSVEKNNIPCIDACLRMNAAKLWFSWERLGCSVADFVKLQDSVPSRCHVRPSSPPPKKKKFMKTSGSCVKTNSSCHSYANHIEYFLFMQKTSCHCPYLFAHIYKYSKIYQQLGNENGLPCQV